jgi:hypothetical protein
VAPGAVLVVALAAVPLVAELDPISESRGDFGGCIGRA